MNREKGDLGLVFHIVHGSFVDGYGVRTTVFLKGCPLRCLWCCNPEGQEGHPEIKLTSSKCDGCGRCVKVCPVNAIQLDLTQKVNKVTIDRGLCTNCGKCVEVCYTEALEVCGRYMTVEELFDVVKKDEQFYREMKGGVTVGGGEPTFQPLFISAFLKKCQDNYIHTALDSCGFTVNDESLKNLESADLLLYDLKGMNPQEHLRNTGVSNDLIIQNLKKLNAKGKPIIIRLPLIPGYNDSTENIEATGKLLTTLKSIERLDLLAYHKLGVVKHQQLGKEYRLNTQPPGEDYIDDMKHRFERYGLNVQIGG